MHWSSPIIPILMVVLWSNQFSQLRPSTCDEQFEFLWTLQMQMQMNYIPHVITVCQMCHKGTRGDCNQPLLSRQLFTGLGLSNVCTVMLNVYIRLRNYIFNFLFGNTKPSTFFQINAIWHLKLKQFLPTFFHTACNNKSRLLRVNCLHLSSVLPFIINIY